MKKQFTVIIFYVLYGNLGSEAKIILKVTFWEVVAIIIFFNYLIFFVFNFFLINKRGSNNLSYQNNNR